MDLIVNLKNALERIAQAEQLMNVALERGKLSSIERDLILEKIRRAYDDLTFEPASEAPREKSSVKAELPEPPPRPETVESILRVPTARPPKDATVETEDKVEQTAGLKERTVAPPLKPHIEPKNPENTQIKPAIPSTEPSFERVFVPEPNPIKAPTPTIEAAAPSPAPGEILADKFKDNRKFRNESMGTPKRDVATKLQGKPITDLSKAIGINDKFLFTKELFNGNAELYSTTVKKLNGFTDINDALIYVQENFLWDETNEAANRLLELVRRKLLAN